MNKNNRNTKTNSQDVNILLYVILVFQYEEAFHKATVERDQIAQQYQQYTEQLNSQQTQLQTQVATLIEERENLVERQAELQGLIQQYESKQQDQSESLLKIVWYFISMYTCMLSLALRRSKVKSMLELHVVWNLCSVVTPLNGHLNSEVSYINDEYLWYPPLCYVAKVFNTCWP